MPLSRRALFRLDEWSGASSLPLITARGREALVEELGPLAGEFGPIPLPQEGEVRISSNENPLGPPPGAVAAIRESFLEAGRYPTNAQPSMRDLTNALADKHGCQPDNIVLGAGSGEILKNAAHAFTNKYRPMITGTPSYLQPTRVSRFLGAEVKAIPVFRATGKLDLEAMASAARGPSMIFVCNPNNPTSTVHTASDVRSFVSTVRRASPNTVIHLDEAYHEYVTHRDYESAVGLAIETPNVFVTRTFSKCYGMAGMRIGYGVGHRDVIATLRRYSLTFNTNTPGVGAAYAALHERGFTEREQRRNTEAKKLTVDFFKRKGYDLYDSQANFIFVDLGSPAADFRSASRQHGVSVGRDFPPMQKTHARISIGTSAEMQRAVEVFEEVLA
jgi:histidinol-phosphate aminotransferase